jgi:hypothetical protein
MCARGMKVIGEQLAHVVPGMNQPHGKPEEPGSCG